MKGFTLIEILLIVAALAVLSGVSIIAINPVKQLADVRNAQRRIDIGELYSALQQYALNHHGTLPANIPTGELADCQTDPASSAFTICRTQYCPVTLTELTAGALYLSEIPFDPKTHTEDLSGYNVIRDTNFHNRITVCAPAAEEGESIYIPH